MDYNTLINQVYMFDQIGHLARSAIYRRARPAADLVKAGIMIDRLITKATNVGQPID